MKTFPQLLINTLIYDHLFSLLVAVAVATVTAVLLEVAVATAVLLAVAVYCYQLLLYC